MRMPVTLCISGYCITTYNQSVHGGATPLVHAFTCFSKTQCHNSKFLTYINYKRSVKNNIMLKTT